MAAAIRRIGELLRRKTSPRQAATPRQVRHPIGTDGVLTGSARFGKSRPVTFFAWLCGLDKAVLGRVIANRPETALLARPPRDRAELASRLQHEALIGLHYLMANRPVHDVVDMVAASGGHSTIGALAKAF